MAHRSAGAGSNQKGKDYLSRQGLAASWDATSVRWPAERRHTAARLAPAAPAAKGSIGANHDLAWLFAWHHMEPLYMKKVSVASKPAESVRFVA